MRSLLLICLLGAGAAQAQSLDTFMHIDGIVGDAQAAGHVNGHPADRLFPDVCRQTCSRVVATKFIDRSSPALISRAASNLFIPSVVISVRKTSGAPSISSRPCSSR